MAPVIVNVTPRRSVEDRLALPSVCLVRRSDYQGSKWTVKVQRLLQPTRELAKSEYEVRVENQGTVITR